MPAKSHKTDYIILGVLGAFAALVFGLVLGSDWARRERDEQMMVRTTHTTNKEGLLVCHTLYERFDYPVRRVTEPLLHPALKDTNVLFIISPIVRIQKGEMDALSGWIHAGGVLICTANIARGLLGTSDTWMLTPPPSAGPRSVQGLTTDIPAEAQKLPLARDVARVQFQHGALIEEGEFAGPGGGRKPEPLLEDGAGVRIAALTRGKGRVAILADSSFLANGRIGEADNAVVAVNLLDWAISNAKGNRVAFDEYHFGFGHHESHWEIARAMLFQTPPGWAVLCLAGAGVLLLILKGRRFGTRRAPGRPRRRSKMEFVRGVGATYKSSGAHRLAFRLIYDQFRMRLSQRLGLPASAPVDAVAASVSRYTGRPARRYQAVLTECERAVAGGRMFSLRGSALLKRLAQLEREVFDEGRRRQ